MGQIGSLWYNIGAKTAEFQKALTDSKSKLQNFGTQLNGVSRAVTGFDASTIASAAGIGVLVTEYRKAIAATMEYAYQVRTLSRDIGGTPEDISKLIQAADDAQVSFETMKTAMVMANKQGVDVTIQGMMNLADQYLAIQNPLDRTRFLTDTFGRSGEQLGALMAMGAAGIEAAGIEAEKYGRILSESAIQQTEKFRIAQDNLDDSLAKMKDTLALEVMPSLTTLINTVNPVINAYNSMKSALDSLDPALKGIITTMYSFLDPIKAIMGPLVALISAFRNLISVANQANAITGGGMFSGATAGGLGFGSTAPSTGSGVSNPAANYYAGGTGGNRPTGLATGGSFTVPGSGYESFNMGGVATATPGEKINVERPGMFEKLVKELRAIAYDPYENVRITTDYLIKTGR